MKGRGKPTLIYFSLIGTSKFRIDAETGTVYFNEEVDFDAGDTSISFTITATDRNSHSTTAVSPDSFFL